MKRRSSALALPRLALPALGLVASLAAAPVHAAPSDVTRIDTAAAAVVDGVLHVTGRATFADGAEQVGEDPTGDAYVPGIGADIRGVTLARPFPGNDLVFALAIADQPPPQIGAVPEVVLHWWEFSISDEERTRTFVLIGMRGGQWQSPGRTSENMTLLSCPGLECRPIAKVAGAIRDGAVRWVVPAALVGARGGASVDTGGVETLLTTAGAFWGLVRYDAGGASAGPWTIPQAQVRFGIAPVDSDPENIAPTFAATVEPDGRFGGGLELSGYPPGEYMVVVEACYREGDCGRATMPVTR